MASSQPDEGPGTPRRKSRRSWFDAPPLTTLEPPSAVQKPQPKPTNPKRRSLDSVETLTLTHFTNPPKISFGKILLGKTKFRTLLIRNPHDYDQEVIIERFPFKKKFMVDHTRFIVGPEEVFSLQITWTPEEDGGFREMVQFHINEVYRLQAFLIGTVEKPKPPRKVRRHPLGPRVKQPTTIVQTPALTSIKSSYSPRRSQEARELLEDITRHVQDENKENSGEVPFVEQRSMMMEIPAGTVLKASSQKENNVTTGIEARPMPKDGGKIKQRDEVPQTPPPLESTTIASKQEKVTGSQRSRSQWKSISDATNPTLNMSPIPLSEDNENGITVDSYFQPNDTGVIISTGGRNLTEEFDKKRNDDVRMSGQTNSVGAMKQTFIMPPPPSNVTSFTKVKTRELESTEDRTDTTYAKSVTSCTVVQAYEVQRVDETKIIRKDDTEIMTPSNAKESLKQRKTQCSMASSEQQSISDANQMEMRRRSDWTSPTTAENANTSRTSPASPRTLLDESLSLISQMKVPPRSPDISPRDADQSINASLISQGQGMVSPNSFLEDMRNMANDSHCRSEAGNKNTSTPNALSPSAALDTSIPHEIMVNHLRNVKSSFHDSPHRVSLPAVRDENASRKPPSSRFGSKRRSITSQFQRDEVKRVAAVAKAFREDKKSCAKGNESRGLPRKNQEQRRDASNSRNMNQREASLYTKVAPSPRRETFAMKKKSTEMNKGPVKKRSPVVKRSPRPKRSPKQSTQDLAMRRVKGRIIKVNSPGKASKIHSNSRDMQRNSNPEKAKESASDMTTDKSLSDDKVSLCREGTPRKDHSTDVSDGITPGREEHSVDSGTVIKSRSFESGTVVKCRSLEEAQDTSEKFFDDLSTHGQNEKDDSCHKNSSLTRRGKLFPDIEVPENCDAPDACHINDGIHASGENEKFVKVLKDAKELKEAEHAVDELQAETIVPEVVIMRTEFIENGWSGSDKITYENYEVQASPSRSKMDRIINAAERSMSPHKFYAVSPSNLPTSPGAGLEPTRRGTLTVTKSRPSDALLTAMNNRKRLFQDSAHTQTYLVQEDDTETQENINVRVEEHYQKIDGKMYLVVKETTDVIKSTTETYMEQMSVSPRQFQTPTRLPNSPDPQLSRRSTHVVRSPKVIDVASMNKKRLEFVEETTQGSIEKGEDNGQITEQNNESCDVAASISVEQEANSSSCEHESSRIKSDTFEKEATIIVPPDEHEPETSLFAASLTEKMPRITSVCVMSPNLVDYEVASEDGGSNDVTKDSLEADQSLDSLDKTDEAESCSLGNQNNMDEIKSVKGEESLVTSLSQKSFDNVCMKTSTDEETSAKNQNNFDSLETQSSSEMQSSCTDVDNVKASEDIMTDVDRSVLTDKEMGAKIGTKECVDKENVHTALVTEDESEDEKFYDTMSERYYDALSDTMDADVEDVDLKEHDQEAPLEICPDNEYREQCMINLDRKDIPFKDNAKQEETKYPLVNEVVDRHLPHQNHLTAFTSNMTESQNAQTIAGVETGIDHMERFEIMEKEVFEVHVVTDTTSQEESILNKNEVKAKQKLRRSVSADILLPTTKSIDELDSSKTSKEMDLKRQLSDLTQVVTPKVTMTQSKSEVFAKPMTQGMKRNLQTKTSKGRLPSGQNEEPGLKKRSQSMSNLAKQTAGKSAMTKAAPNASSLQKMAKQVNQSTHNTSKTKPAPRGVAQRRLILVKKPKTGAPRHPMPYAARNMYYDERWMEKQERGFVQWLNFVLTPPDEYVAVVNKAKVDAGSLSLDTRNVAPRLAPTKEILSFRAYAARRRLNRLRRAACELYQSEPIVSIICKIETEVESRRIAVRKDRMVHADLGIKQRLLDLLLQYSSLWLRIGLETVFGEVLMLQSNQDFVGLSRFIVTRLLASPDIAAEFSHPTVPHLYKDGYAAAMSRHTVKKFLLLVYFLDQAKSSRLIDHDPCLFCKDAEIKASKEILIRFSQEVLSGEGDITRHLAYLGYTVSQTQKPIDEFDFAVTSLSSDLRDGLRLCRVLELLANDHGIMRKLRTPAISRLQKIHNTEAFFKAMSARGLDFSAASGSTTARDVVDGHREKTLSLLWHLIIHFQSSIQVNEEQLKEEIDMLIKSLQLKVAMQKIHALPGDEAARRDSGETKLLMENQRLQLIFQWCRLVCLHYGVKIENFTVSFSDGRALCCLLHHYHPALLPLSEIRFQTTVSFQEAAENKCQVETDPDQSMDWGCGGGLMPDENDPEMYERLLANEKSNFKTLYEKVSALGGVPLMLRFADMSNTIPDEKVVSTYVSYLCARLLDIREEVRAARLIQMAWRRRQLQRAVRERKRRTNAAIVLQRWIRPYLAKQMTVKQLKAATCIQAAWRAHLARGHVEKLKRACKEEARRAEEEKAAVTLQSLWRSRSARHELMKLRQEEQMRVKQFKAATCIQAAWRGRLARHHIKKLRKAYQEEARRAEEEKAAVTLQSLWRSRSARHEFVKLRQEEQMRVEQSKAATCIQAAWRAHLACLHVEKLRKAYQEETRRAEEEKAAVTLQSLWRSRSARHEFVKLRQEEQMKVKQSKAATCIQAAWRAHLACRHVEKLRKAYQEETRRAEEEKAAVTLQSLWRSRSARHELVKLRQEKELQDAMRKEEEAAVKLQSCVRRLLRRKEFLRQRSAALMIQTLWRGQIARKLWHTMKRERYEKSATVIQKWVRRQLCLSQYGKQRNAAIVLQKNWRMQRAKHSLQLARAERQANAAILIQKYVRGHSCARKYRHVKKAAIVLQSSWRGKQAIKQLKTLKTERNNKAATTVQNALKTALCRRKFMMKKKAAVVLQKTWRKTLAQRQLAALKLERKNSAAVVIQKHFRGFQERQMFSSTKKAAVVIQSLWRMHQAQEELGRLRSEFQEKSAIVIQKHYRGFRERQAFARYKCAVTVLQKNWRKCLAVKELNNLRHQQQDKAALMLQKNLKAWKCRKDFMKMRSAATVIQSSWRRVQAMRQMAVIREQKQNTAAELIQKVWRGYNGRKAFTEKKIAALTVQSYWRMSQAKQQYWRIREAVIILQAWHRANMAAREQRANYCNQKKAAVCIQSWWRGKQQRQRYLRLRHSAIVIQANIRCFRRRLKFLALKLAAIIVQQGYRSYRKGRKVREEYFAKRHAAITIQRSLRSYLDRKHIIREASALVLQTVYRKIRAQKKYNAQKKAALLIQNWYRQHQQSKYVRQEFLRQKQAARVIQSAYRTYRLKKQYEHVCQTVVKLQAMIRCKIAVKRFEEMRMAARVLQRHYRAAKLACIAREEFLHQRQASITIQRCYRAVCTGRAVRKEIALQNEAATKIQSLYRGWSQRQDYLLFRAAIICLQRRYRALRLGRVVRREAKQLQSAALVIQREWRGYKQIQEAKRQVEEMRLAAQKEMERKLEEERLVLERKKEEERLEAEQKVEELRRERAAVAIQRCVRAFLIMKDYTKMENAATLIQRHFRGYQARKQYKSELQQVLKLQFLIKGFACRRQFERKRLATTLIQRRWREIIEGRHCRAAFIRKQQSAVKVQAIVKMRIQMTRYQQMLKRIILLQAFARMVVQRHRYLELKRLVACMQRKVRSKQKMRCDRALFLQQRHSAIKIQSVVRLWLAYRQIQKQKSVIRIQTHWRMHQQRVAFRQEHSAIQILQSFMDIKQQQIERQRRETAAQIIQNSFRQYLSKQKHIKDLAARIIQRTFQRHHSQIMKEKDSAALIVQRVWRKYAIKKQIEKEQKAVRIQAAARQFIQRRRYLKLRNTVILLQAAIRGWQARQIAESLRARHRAALCLQAFARGYLTRKRLAPLIQERLRILQEKRNQHRASILIQARWRGFVTRRNTKSKKLKQARQRLEKANRSATHEKTLGSRTSSALDYLLQERDLAAILEALMHLEVCTRLSPVCCERMVEVNAIIVLYRLIGSCNRSVPHMELIKYSVNILLNLAKYDKTVAAVIEPPESVATIADLLQIYREKGPIFFNCCMLLGILGLHPGRRAQILAHPHIVERLQSIHALTLRKQRANQNRQVTQAKMAARRGFNCTLPVLTPTKSKRKRIRPEWVLARDNIKDFDEPLAAVTYVMDVLQIGPKL